VTAARVSVLIVSFNPGVHLQRALDALTLQTVQDFDVILWDNASTDGVIESLRLPPRTRLVRSPDNLGFAAGNNRAAALSAAPYLALLNPDAFPEPEWLARLLAAADRTGAAAIGSLQLMDDDPDRLDGAGDVLSICGVGWRGGHARARARYRLREGETFSACAAAVLYRREAFDRAGGFDERYFCCFEDVDLGFRLRLLGERTVLAPDAIVRHVGSATTGRASDFSIYHGARNRLWTLLRCMPALLWPIAVPSFIGGQLLLLARDLARGRASASWRGVRDGLKGAGAMLHNRPARGASLARTLQVARALSWSPLALLDRRPVLRRLRP
jgi:GT2 family glycosyltransferase